MGFGNKLKKTVKKAKKTVSKTAKVTATVAKVTAVANKAVNNQYVDLSTKIPLFGEIIEAGQGAVTASDMSVQALNSSVQRVDNIVNSGGSTGNEVADILIAQANKEQQSGNVKYTTTKYVQTSGGLVPVQDTKSDNKNLILIGGGVLAAVMFLGMKGKKKR